MRVVSRFFQLRQHIALSAASALLVLLVIVLPAAALQFDPTAIQKYAQANYGARSGQQVSRWLVMMSQQNGQPELQQLRAVNSFWNTTVRGGEDRHIWGKEDYWATPLETLGKQQGDCEDFVIGKYFSLVHIGVPAEKLRFIYVRARIGGIGSRKTIAHMVLGYYPSPDAVPYILDNLTGSISKANQRPDLTPVFSFNAQGVYVTGAATSSPDRIGNWRDLLSRMQREGFKP